MKEMQRFAPELKKIQEKYKDDRALQQEKVMAFYKEHGVNPMAGCLPMLVQMPFLWGVYHAISLYQFQFTRETFLWVNPAAARASADWPSPFTGSIAPNLGEQDLLLLFVYALSMYFQTRLTPVSDPAQAEQQKVMAYVMPVMFFIMMLQWHLPSAFVLYWFLSNVLMVAQQWYINRGIILPPLPATALSDGGGDIAPAAAGVAALKSGNGAKVGNGVGEAKKPSPPNQRIISPKNRRRVRKK
jgi:YidC/Oxa1 family membrane protein insertase